MSKEGKNDDKKVKVMIFGDEYVIKAEESAEYIKQVAQSVNDEIEKVNNQNNRLSRIRIMVLSSLHLADKYYKAEEEKKTIKNKFKTSKTKEYRRDQQYKELSNEHNNLKKKYETLQKKYDAIKKAHNKLEQKYTGLKKDYCELEEEYDAFLTEFGKED
ncbi:cell division protein ZapA [Selenihalanaerobacter shriftii]|uniref:Cell division protein ZapA n=1 Tax=Selenihalanaerobacter shriftii TaxID=142842 RepID=A0A1T4QM49_9FIRM|nr:cell division protein ZapA [Selenihalanaerobacter shriftii]SKA04840.1 cell division protein ZapA [Selenihalanaerobacter shriftii]